MSGHIHETRLNDYLEGLVSPAERASVDEHLASCEACSADLEALSELVSEVGRLPGEARPDRDLWVGIRERMDRMREADVLSFPGVRRERTRWVRATIPQLAAAGLALAFVSGGAVWLALSGGRSEGARSARESGTAQLVRTLPTELVAAEEYERAVASLQEIVDRGRGVLDPETLATIEASLRSIEDAIQEAQDALAADPDSDLLHRLLINHQQAKLRVLQRAATAARL